MFRKLLTLSILAPISASFAGGMGDLAPAAEMKAPATCEQRAWEIGPEVFGMNTSIGGTVNTTDRNAKISGAMFGLSGSYTYRDELFARLQIGAAWGRQKVRFTDANGNGVFDFTDLTGGAGTTRLQVKRSTWIIEPRALLGYDNAFELGNAKFTPFTGFGWRHVNVARKNNSSGIRQNTLYIPLGMEVNSCLDNGWSLDVNGEADFGVHSRVNVRSNAATNSTSKLKTGFNWGLRGAVTLSKDFGDFAVGAEPFVKFWSARKGSDNNTTVRLRRVRSTEIGGKLKFAF